MDRPTTKKCSFFDITCTEHKLLSVNAGVPSEEALDFASTLLAEVISLARRAADDANTHEAWAVMHMAEVAKAVIDSVSLGLSEREVRHG